MNSFNGYIVDAKFKTFEEQTESMLAALWIGKALTYRDVNAALAVLLQEATVSAGGTISVDRLAKFMLGLSSLSEPMPLNVYCGQLLQIDN